MRKVTQVDLETGEDLGGFVAVIRPKQKSSFERHFTMNQAALKIIATELNHEQTKVLMMLLADLDYENYIQVAQINIAESLAMKKSAVSRAIRHLLEFGIILEGAKNWPQQNLPTESTIRMERNSKQPQESAQKRPQCHSGWQGVSHTILVQKCSISVNLTQKCSITTLHFPSSDAEYYRGLTR